MARTHLRSMRHFAALVCVVLIAPAAVRAEATLADLEAIEKAFVELARQVGPSVVSIETKRESPEEDGPIPQRRGPMIGSGVIIDADGLILTNDHVVRAGDRVFVTLDSGRRHEARIVSSDERSDLAVIRIESKGLSPAKMGDLSDVKVGQFALALGNPFGTSRDGQASLSYGIVSALGRTLRELEDKDRKYYGNLIQTTADINPGNSGGPLFNIRGQLIGINTALETRPDSGDNLGYAIPICERTRKVIATLSLGQKVHYGGLGVQIEDEVALPAGTDGSGDSRGVMVKEVLPDSPALQAGIRKRDRIVRYASELVQSVDHLIRLVGATPVGENVPVVIRRAGEDIVLQATIAPREAVLTSSQE